MDIAGYLTHRPATILAAFLAIHVGVWTLMPVAFGLNLPLDMIEQLAWGNAPQWNYFKHPPLPAWVLGAVDRLTFGSDLALFAVGPVFAALAIWAVWRLGCLTLGPWQGLVGAMSLEAVHYFNFTAVEFNHNIVLLPIWPLMALATWHALTANRARWWVLAGVLAALGMLGKYVTILFLPTLIGVALSTARTRLLFRSAGPWLAVTAGLLALGPHLASLLGGELGSLQWGTARLGERAGIWSHLTAPLNFAAAQAAAFLPPALLVAMLLARGRPAPLPAGAPQAEFGRIYIRWIFLGPLVLALFLSAALGAEFKDMWGTPMFGFVGLFCLTWMGGPITGAGLRRFAALWGIMAAAAAIAFAGIILLHPLVRDSGKRVYFPGDALAARIGDMWATEQPGRPLRIVIGTSWTAGNIAHYLRDDIDVLLDGNFEHAPWVTPDDLAREGAIIVWRVDRRDGWDETEALARFPAAMPMGTLSLPLRRGRDLPAAEIGWAILPPSTPAPSGA